MRPAPLKIFRKKLYFFEPWIKSQGQSQLTYRRHGQRYRIQEAQGYVTLQYTSQPNDPANILKASVAEHGAEKPKKVKKVKEAASVDPVTSEKKRKGMPILKITC